MDEAHKKRRQQAIRVALTEILMLLAVGCLATFLTMVVLGYRIGEDFSIEQSGLVQIDSVPTGASVAIDEETVLYRTNLSKTATSGVHMIEISKNGYDGWKKEINVTAGYYYRLVYPRLFLEEIKTRKITQLTEGEKAFPASGSNSVLVVSKMTPVFRFLTFNGEKMTEETVDVGGFMNWGEGAEIEEIRWNKSSALIRTNYLGQIEWSLIDFSGSRTNVNLTKAYGLEFEDVQFEDESTGRVMSLVGGGVREINLNDGKISQNLLTGVVSFDVQGENLVYVGIDEDGKYVGMYQNGDKMGTRLYDAMKSDDEVLVAISEYYGDDLVTIIDGDDMKVYQGQVPGYGEKAKKMELMIDVKIGFLPSKLEIKGRGELAIASNGKKMAVFDAEMFGVKEYEATIGKTAWLDEFMMVSTENGAVVVSDFDGLNEKRLIEGNVMPEGFVLLSGNGRWMYYLDAENNIVVARVG